MTAVFHLESQKEPTPMQALPLPEQSIVSLESVVTLVKSVAEPARDRTEISADELKRIFSLTDLTTLRPTDTSKTIGALAKAVLEIQQRVPALPPLGGVCVPGDGVASAVRILKGNDTRVATVVNFPLGQSPLSAVLDETRNRLLEGVEEIDLVFPLARYLGGEPEADLVDFVLQVKNLCAEFGAPLKTIIQSDEIEAREGTLTEQGIRDLERLAAISYSGGSDMVKTSTGKGAGGASFEAAAIISQVAKYYREQTDYSERVGHDPGMKFSGGISDGATAQGFIALSESVLGERAITPTLFRFGASGLVNRVVESLRQLGGNLSTSLRENGIDDSFFSSPSGNY